MSKVTVNFEADLNDLDGIKRLQEVFTVLAGMQATTTGVGPIAPTVVLPVREQKPAVEQKPAATQKPAAEQKPAATQEPAATQKPAADGALSIEEVRRVLNEKVDKHRAECKAKLGELNAKSLTLLDPAKYQDFYDFLNSLD